MIYSVGAERRLLFALAGSLALNVLLLSGGATSIVISEKTAGSAPRLWSDLVQFTPPISCKLPNFCTCEAKPLGSDTYDLLSKYYPWGNATLASVFDTRAYLSGAVVPLSRFRGAKVTMVANTASNWGFGPSNFAGFQVLLERYSHLGFQLLAFPCNQFGEQEPGSDGCARAYFQGHVPAATDGGAVMFDAVDVNGPGQTDLFAFLKASAAKQAAGAWRAPWNSDVDSIVTWNYYKFVVDGEGRLVRGGFLASPQSPVEAEPLIREMLGLEPLAAEGLAAAEPEPEPEPE